MRRWLGFLLLLLTAALLAACGETIAYPLGPTAAPGVPPAPTDTTTAAGGTAATPPATEQALPAPVATATPIPRQGRFEYPRQMQVSKPAKVQFSLFVAEAAPATLSGAITDTRSLQIPAGPSEKTPFVSVRLIPTGADVIKEENKEPQALRPDFNIWRWEITAPDAGTVDLRLQVHVAYCADDGQDCQGGHDLVWQPPAGGNTIPVLPDNPLLALLKQAETSLGAAFGLLTGFLSLASTCVGIMVGSISILEKRKEAAAGPRT